MNTQDALEKLAAAYDDNRLPVEAAAEAMSIYLEMGERIAELDVIRSSARQVVVDALATIGTDRLETPSGQCYDSKSVRRVNYDAKGLDKLTEALPDLAPVLAPYRTEKEVAGALMIRAGKN